MKKRRTTRIAHTHFWDIFRQSNTYDHDLAEAGDVFDIGVKVLKVRIPGMDYFPYMSLRRYIDLMKFLF